MSRSDYAIDPELLESVEGSTDIRLDDIHAARILYQRETENEPPVDTAGLDVSDELIPGVDGHRVPVRLYRPHTQTGCALLFLHAGGMVLGGLDGEHGRCTQLARDLGAVVVSVDYRLAPEHPYPAAPEDCYSALLWLTAESSALDVSQHRIAVFGRSAGGGLTAAVALMARDRGGPKIAFQFMDIPMLDDRMNSHSALEFTDTPNWDSVSSRLAWGYYLGGAAGGEDVPAYAAPARATDLSGLPHAYVHTAQFDPLRDEGIAYAQRLMEAGVPTELHSSPRTYHGSSHVEDATISRRLADERMAVLRRAFGL